MTVACEHGIDPSVLNKELFHQLSDCQFFEDPCTIEVVNWGKFHGWNTLKEIAPVSRSTEVCRMFVISDFCLFWLWFVVMQSKILAPQVVISFPLQWLVISPPHWTGQTVGPSLEVLAVTAATCQSLSCVLCIAIVLQVSLLFERGSRFEGMYLSEYMLYILRTVYIINSTECWTFKLYSVSFQCTWMLKFWNNDNSSNFHISLFLLSSSLLFILFLVYYCYCNYYNYLWYSV